MDHVVEGEIFGAEGLRRVLLQIQMRGHSFMITMISISMPFINVRVSEAYLVTVHLHIKSEMRDLLKLAQTLTSTRSLMFRFLDVVDRSGS